MTTNEAAERLLLGDAEPTADEIRSYRLGANDPAMREYNWTEWRAHRARQALFEALAAAKAEGAREAVERIRARVIERVGAEPRDDSPSIGRAGLFAILDEEAAR